MLSPVVGTAIVVVTAVLCIALIANHVYQATIKMEDGEKDKFKLIYGFVGIKECKRSRGNHSR